MKTEEFKLLLNNIEDKYIDKAGEALERYHEYISEGSCVEAPPTTRRRGHIAAIICAAAVCLGAFVVLLNIGRIKSFVNNASGKENYLGGMGEFHGNYYLEDDTNIYIPDTEKGLLLKFDKKTETLSVACQTKGCAHNSDSCRANLRNNTRYCSIGGRLIKSCRKSDPSYSDHYRSFLYLCEDGEKQVFRYEFPEGVEDEELANMTPAIGPVYALDDEHLAVVSSACAYILDKDFKIQQTILDLGPYSGGIYCVDDIIYYINEQYNLMKIDPSSGRHYVYDLSSRKITEGALVGDDLWFSDEDQEICALDITTGEVREAVGSGMCIEAVGEYIKYISSYDYEICFIETKSGRLTYIGKDSSAEMNAMFFANGKYYSFHSSVLLEYDADNIRVIKHMHYAGGRL